MNWIGETVDAPETAHADPCGEDETPTAVAAQLPWPLVVTRLTGRLARSLRSRRWQMIDAATRHIGFGCILYVDGQPANNSGVRAP